MKRISLVVIILITILMGCKQATSPSTPSVPAVPPVEDQKPGEENIIINLTGLKNAVIGNATESMASIGQFELKEDLTTDPVNVTWDLNNHIDTATKTSALQQAVVWSLNQGALTSVGIKNIETANVSVAYTGTVSRSSVATGEAEVTVSSLQALDGYEFAEGSVNSFTINFTEESIVLADKDISNKNGIKPVITEGSTYSAVGAWKLENAVLSDAKIAVEELKKATYESVLASVGNGIKISNVEVKNIAYKDTSVAGNVAIDNDGEKTVVVTLEANNGYVFEGLVSQKVIELTFTVEQLQPVLDTSSFVGNTVAVTSGKAGVSSAINLGSESAIKVDLDVADIFDVDMRKIAVEQMIYASFIDRLLDVYKGVTIKQGSMVVTEGAEANVSFTLVAPEEYTFAKVKGSKEEEVTVKIENEHGAFTGNLQPIEQKEISATYLPTIENAVIMGASESWTLSSGIPNGGTRKIAVREGSGISIDTVLEGMKAKMLEDSDTNEKYEFSHFGELSVDSLNSDKTNIKVIFKKKDGYLFYNGEATYETTVGVIFQEGALKVNDEDFAETLEALSKPENLGVLASENEEGQLEVTLDITGDISKGGENDTDGSFTIDAGDTEKPLNVILESTKEGGAAVSGGNVLTSLVVTGNNTTVTVGEGVTINGGLNETGGGGGVIVKNGATFILDGGIITGNESRIAQYYEGGGAVTVFEGTFIMNSGSITGNKAYRGAGVYVVNNTGRKEDGSTKASFLMNGGSIDNNTTVIEGSVNSSGGGSGVFIYGDSAEFIMGEEGKDYTAETIPTIKANSASRMGSAITVSTNATLTINDGLITENVGPFGVIGFAAGGTMNLLGGEIKDNLYGPLNEDGTLNNDLASTVDIGKILGWVGNIENGVVSKHSGALTLNHPENGTIIEGANPIVQD